MRPLLPTATSLAALTLLLACNKPEGAASRESSPAASSAPSSSAPAASASVGTPAAEATVDAGASTAQAGALHLGAAIEPKAPTVALADVARAPKSFVGKSFVTQGKVTAVCQHKGCWMEIKDDASEAHIKMAGHKFFVPRTAEGHKAKVLATLVQDEGASCGDDEGTMSAEGAPAHEGAHKKGGGCREEAEAQLGRPLAKLALVATGVELD